MNLRDNKGFVGIDISMAVIILLILVPSIMGIVFSINSSQNAANVRSEAISIAVNALETAKGTKLSELTENGLLTKLRQGIYSGKATDGDAPDSLIITIGKASYKLQVLVVDYKNTAGHSDAKENVVKTVTARVTYKARGEVKELEIKTVVK